MTRPSRLFLALAAVALAAWKLDTASRWQGILAPSAPLEGLLTDSVLALPRMDTARPAKDTAPGPDPFGTIEPKAAPVRTASVAAPVRPRAAPGPRPWKLMGLVGTRSAILASGDKTWVVGSGERIGNVRVVSIGTSCVTLEDEAGTWTLATDR